MEFDPELRIHESEEVYPPSKDSFLLLEAIDLTKARSFCELGTGTGLIALHAARHCLTVATDVNPYALALARRNARHNGLRLRLLRADLFAGIRGRFDVLAFNPPYLPDTRGGGWLDAAWNGGADGNRVIHRFLDSVGAHLTRSGRAYLLLSSHNEAPQRRAEAEYQAVRVAQRSLFFEEIAVHALTRAGRVAHKV